MEENKNNYYGEESNSSPTENIEYTTPVDGEVKEAAVPENSSPRSKKSHTLAPKYVALIIASALIVTAVIVLLVLALGGDHSVLDGDEPVVDNSTLPEDPEGDEVETLSYSQGLEYMLSAGGDHYVVTGRGSCVDTTVKIPPEYQGKPVTSIGTAAFENEIWILSIILPETVSRIEAGAFQGCSSLEKVVVSDGITYVGRDAFKSCFKLENKTVCENMEYIGTDDNPYYFLVEVQNGNTYDVNPNTKIIGANAFAETLVAEISIPEGVEIINYGAFAECYMLKSISLPASLVVIEEGVFGGCSSLVYNEYDNGLYLGNDSNPYFAFLGLKDSMNGTLVINQQTVIIADCAFIRQESLKNLTIPVGLRIIGIHAFDRCSLSHVYYGGSVEDWSKIIIREGNSGFKNASIHFNFAG